jgi:dipeptidyl aminopeptidase/acylaminoacyl peptidase
MCSRFVLVVSLVACGSSEPKRRVPPVAAIDARTVALTARAAGIADAFSNANAVLVGDRVVFASNRAGSWQLHVASATDPGAPATRLVSWPQPIHGAQPTPDGTALVFAADAGGDEQPLLYRVGLDGSAPVELTGGEKLSRDGEIMPARQPGALYYSARAPEATAWAIHRAKLDASRPPEPVYRDSQNGFLVDVRADGAVALIQHFHTWSARVLLAVDLAKGRATRLYPPSGEVSIDAATFTPDGRVLVATDGGGEQALLLALDSRGKELARHVAVARIDAIRVAPVGRGIALAIDAGNRTMIELVDGDTLRPRCTVALPLGTGSLGDYSADGAQLTATWSTSAVPSDIFAIDVATCAARPLRHERRPSLDDLRPVDSKIVAIAAFDGTPLPTNIHLPQHDENARLPVIVRYHGGPAGSSTMGWQRLARFFLDQGYAWVEPNVRGSGGFGRAFEQADNGKRRLDAFRDIETTARWVAEQPWADPERMIVLGESYGGYAVLTTLIRHSSLWRAGVDLFGLADLTTFMSSTTGRVRANYLVELGDPATDGEFLASISPLAQVDQIEDPLFVYAGANDPRVPRAQSDAIVAALRARRVPVDYHVAADEGHGMEGRDTFVEVCVRLAKFLEQHVPPDHHCDDDAGVCRIEY